MKKLKKLKVKVARPHDVIGETLLNAVERGMNRTDKYSTKPLNEQQRGLLAAEIETSFWLMLDEAGLVIVGG